MVKFVPSKYLRVNENPVSASKRVIVFLVNKSAPFLS